MIILLCVSFWLALDFIPEVPTSLSGIETDAAILSVTVFTLVILRVWRTAREASKRATTTPES